MLSRSLIVLAVVATVSVVVVCGDNVAEIDGKLSALETQLKEVESRFHSMQSNAANKDDESADAMKVMSALMAKIHMVDYTVRRKALEAAKKVLEQHSGQISHEMAEALILRASLRAAMDSADANRHNWNSLQLWMKQAASKSDDAKEASEKELADQDNLKKETFDLYHAYQEKLSTFDDQNGQQDQMDRWIDEAMDCSECSEMFRDGHELQSRLYCYPMFSKKSAVLDMVRKTVDSKFVEEVRSTLQAASKKITNLPRDPIFHVRQGEIEKPSDAL